MDSKILNVEQLIETFDTPFFEKHNRIYQKHHIVPKMAAILPTDDPGSISYMKGIANFCKSHSIGFEDFMVKSRDELENTIHRLNKSDVHGFMVMYPANCGVKDTYFMNMINPEKDVEGLHYSNQGYLVQFEKY